LVRAECGGSGYLVVWFLCLQLILEASVWVTL
jgi:hypothetical protein